MNNKNEKQKIEQILRFAFSEGMRSIIITEKFYSELDMYEQSNITEKHFQNFLEEHKESISKLLLK